MINIKETQQHILDIIFSSKEVAPRKNRLLETISDLSDKAITIILDYLGMKLRSFAKAIDLEHPDLDIILKDSALILESVVRLSQHLADNNYPYLDFPKLLPGTIIKQLSALEDPLKNQQNIRFLKSSTDRNELRKNKKIQPIQFGHATRKDDMVWNNQPSNFDTYIPWSDAYKLECEKTKVKAERYKKLSCDFLYQEMMKGIGEYESQFIDNHYGFYRITMTSAALILAKMHEYDCSETPVIDEYSINKKRVAGYEVFCPVVVPLFEARFIPPTIEKVVDHLEHFPAAAGKSIFDHYIVLMPSFGYVDVGEFGRVKPVNGANYWNMISSEYPIFVPILMGEANGKCYFICFYC
jgi:hypothetical protein